MDWRGRPPATAEVGVDVQPDCTTSELLGDGAGGAGAEERVEDGVAGEAEQLDQPAGQLLREGGRMPELGPALAGEIPETEDPVHELVALEVGLPAASIALASLMRQNENGLGRRVYPGIGRAEPATPGGPAGDVSLQPEDSGVVDVAKLVDEQPGDVGEDRLFSCRPSTISLKCQIYVDRYVYANPRSRRQNMLEGRSPLFGPVQVLLVGLVITGGAVVLAKVVGRAGYDEVDAGRR